MCKKCTENQQLLKLNERYIGGLFLNVKKSEIVA